MPDFTLIVGVALLLPAAAFLALRFQRRRFHAQARRAGSSLLPQDSSRRLSSLRASVDGLPEPARRYFHFALPGGLGGLTPKLVRTRHRGSIRPAPGGRWFPVQGEQVIDAGQPAFVWHADTFLLPGIWISVCDSLLGRRGRMNVRLWSCLKLADLQGPEIDQSSAARWLMELFWNPPALLHRQVEWEAVDDCRARLRLLDFPQPVSAEIEVDGAGRIARVRSRRYRAPARAGERAALGTFEGACMDWRDSHGWRVPFKVEAGWVDPGSDFQFARFEVTDHAVSPP